MYTELRGDRLVCALRRLEAGGSFSVLPVTSVPITVVPAGQKKAKEAEDDNSRQSKLQQAGCSRVVEFLDKQLVCSPHLALRKISLLKGDLVQVILTCMGSTNHLNTLVMGLVAFCCTADNRGNDL